MKVLMVNKFLYPNGGSETYIFKLGEELVRKGHEVQYFGMEHEKRIVGNRVESYTANMDFHTGKLAKLLYPFKIIYSVEARRKIRRVLEDFEPDVVHLNNFNFQLTPSMIYEVRAYEKKVGRKIRILYTAHDYQWVCPNHMMLIPSSGERCYACAGGKFLACSKNKCIHNSGVKSLLGSVEGYVYKFLKTYDKVDVIICPSEFLRKQLAVNPLLADKCITMHNFIEKEVEPQKAEAQETEAGGQSGFLRAEEREYVLYFGRYTKEKGVATLLEACRRLPEIPFVFAGGGDLEKEVGEVANVENRGFLTGDILEETIRGARLCVFPSEWYENCPFSVMEAQTYGVPVLSADIGGAPELIRVGETGELYEAGNCEELTDKIKALFYDVEKLQGYTEQCGRLEFDTLEEYVYKLCKLYEGEAF